MKRFFISLLIALFIGSAIGKASAPLITIPGNNLNFILPDQHIYHEVMSTAFICWENQTDSLSTIYIKQVYPQIGEDIPIYRDTAYSGLPQLVYLYDENNYGIGWLNSYGNYWRILYRNFYNDSLGQITTICDSLNEKEKFSMNNTRIAYIDSGLLYIKSFLPNTDGYNFPFLVDSGVCSSPELTGYDDKYFTSIIYVKEQNGNSNIFNAEYNYYKNPDWSIRQVSFGVNDINPQWGLSYTEDIVYQSNIDGFWRIQPENLLNLPDSLSYNCTNPFFFWYDIPIKKAFGTTTPYFVLFDSDSIPGNREIFWKSAWWYSEWSPELINLSNVEGDDRKPQVIATFDSLLYFWEHETDGKTDIWW
ncbi:MAG: hypothetical protein V1681_06135, partial [Candidatus Neomarinimicrobiota bacterium]